MENRPLIAQEAPFEMELDALACTAPKPCGWSKSQRLSDGSHKGSGSSPVVYHLT